MTSEFRIRLYAGAVLTQSKARASVWIERVILVLALVFFCTHSFPRTWRSLNTDFPNYYLAAQLVHDGYDTSRMYEWQWIEREKDHRKIDIPVIGLLPITPFSTLFFWPLTFFAPLTAKHIWILLNLAFLVPIAWILRSITGLNYRRIGIVTLLSFPLYRNLLYGQFYVFLLLLILTACISYLREYRALAGALVAIAAVCKIFPLLLCVFFIQRRDWRALASVAITGCSAVAISIALFGLNAHRTWLLEILPWVMHGEGLGTYATSASISGILHRLFLFEPQWNPHPWHYSPLAYAILGPVLQVLLLAPAILLVRRRETSQRQILLEWSALLTAALTTSTIPASYNFALMIFPICVLSSVLLQSRRYRYLLALILAYLIIGLPIPAPNNLSGLKLLLYVPRLPLMIAVLLTIYALLWRNRPSQDTHPDRTRYAWAVAMAISVLFSIHSTLTLEEGERKEYAFRMPLNAQGFLNAGPESTGNGVRFAAFTLAGYQLIAETQGTTQTIPHGGSPYDILSFTANHGQILAERAYGGQSQIIDLQHSSQVLVENAHDPVLSLDGQSLAFLREDHGHERLILRPSFHSSSAEVPLTSDRLNVYEASLLSADEYAFSATSNGEPPGIFLINTGQGNSPILIERSRYPALSPDGRWLAYSHLEHGFWNLWLRNQHDGSLRRIADVPCNEIQPSWENDSKTLLYGSDCGRSIWFTAVARRRVVF